VGRPLFAQGARGGVPVRAPQGRARPGGPARRDGRAACFRPRGQDPCGRGRVKGAADEVARSRPCMGRAVLAWDARGRYPARDDQTEERTRISPLTPTLAEQPGPAARVLSYALRAADRGS
jgi:hypothetical protein